MESFTQIYLPPIALSLQLAFVTTCILLTITLPLAWWLSRRRGNIKSFITAVATLPILLPPSVLGFYLLLILGNQSVIGQLSESLGLGPWVFSFKGLVIASIIYSLPFALQPILNAFDNIDRKLIETAATLGANAWDRFTTIVLPLSKNGILTSIVLSFAHTIGEFGVILMIGGSIPGETKTLSIAIYDHVEALEYTQAHVLSLGMLVFAFIILFCVYRLNHHTNNQSKQYSGGL